MSVESLRLKKGKFCEAVDYKKKYFDAIRQRPKAFITMENDWAAGGDDSEEETEYVNLALMAISDDQEDSASSNQVITANISELSKEECNSSINELSTELYHLHVSLKSLTKENSRIKDVNTFLSFRNSML